MLARTNPPSNRSGHALVIGGSMAGLLAARVLSERFERVTIVERDHFPEGPRFRKGVPQSRHLHALMIRGRMISERLFPGLSERFRLAYTRGLCPSLPLRTPVAHEQPPLARVDREGARRRPAPGSVPR